MSKANFAFRKKLEKQSILENVLAIRKKEINWIFLEQFAKILNSQKTFGRGGNRAGAKSFLQSSERNVHSRRPFVEQRIHRLRTFLL